MRRRSPRHWWLAALCAVLAMLPAAVAAPAARNREDTNGTAIDASDWRSDLEFARLEMPKRHANLFHTLAPADYEAKFDRLAAEVDRLTEHEIVVRLAEIVAAVGDGHSRLTLPMDPQAGFFSGHTGTEPARAQPFHHLPIRLAWTPEGYAVVKADSRFAHLLGARLVGIEGHDVAAIEAALGPVVQRDNEHQLHDLMPMFMVVPEVIHARGLSVSRDRSTWQLEDAGGGAFSVELLPVAPGSATQWSELPAPDWPTAGSARRGALWLEDITQPDAVYVRIAEIAEQPDLSFAEFADRLEEHLATTQKLRFSVDLRGNPGGDNGLNPPISRALIRTPWVSGPGALFVLVDAETFSAAMNLAEDLERWLPAVFVGSGTGARPNSYGDARKLVLPRSGLTIRLSSLFWQNHPNDRRSAIEPLVAAPQGLADLRAGRDSAASTLSSLDDPARELAGRWRGAVAVPFRQTPVELDLDGAGGGTRGSITIRELGVESSPIRSVEWSHAVWTGELTLRETVSAMAGRIGGGRMVGWIEYRGTRFPFVLERI